MAPRSAAILGRPPPAYNRSGCLNIAQGPRQRAVALSAREQGTACRVARYSVVPALGTGICLMPDVSCRMPGRHPGTLLRERVLPVLGLTVSQAARDLQVSRQTLHRILAGDAAITTDMAARLERLCGIRSRFWLGLQQGCELERISSRYGDVYDRIPFHPLPANVLAEIGAVDD